MTWMEDLLTFVLHRNGVEHSPQRRKLNFVGAQLTDDSVNEWTTVYLGDTSEWKGSVRVASTGSNFASNRVGNTLTASGNGNINTLGGIDSISDLALDQLVLLKDQTKAADNGLWKFSDLGTAGSPWIMARATLANESEEVTPGLTTYVDEGTINGRSVWRLKTIAVVLNTTDLAFEPMIIANHVSIDDTDSPYEVNLAQRFVLVDSSGGVVHVDLPPAAEWSGLTITVKDADGSAGANAITVDAQGAETIDKIFGSMNISVNYKSMAFYSDGSNIFVVNRWT